MIEIQLTYKLYHQWKTIDHISVIGSAFHNDKLLKGNDFISYFQECNNEDTFFKKINQIDGQFAVIIGLENIILAAVDITRTFPLFFMQKEEEIIITDKIKSSIIFNKIEIENFKKTYCTLENNTLLLNWKQLQAGEYLIINKLNFTSSIKTYYSHYKETKIELESVLLEKLKILENKLIEKTIQYADNRTILIPLSGGYDSRYILTLLKRYGYEKIECYTYGKKNSYEVLIAKNVAEKLKVKWHFIEYNEELLKIFGTDDWKKYSESNHHFTSLPHEQDFFALHYLKDSNQLPDDAVIINGFCQDIHAGSFIEQIKKIELQKFIKYKHALNLNVSAYENSWNGYQEWLVKNRLSKFIINSVRVYEFFGLDFYLPFWNRDWIDFWYTLNIDLRRNNKFYTDYLFNEIFKEYGVDFKIHEHENNNKLYTLKKIIKTILPKNVTAQIQIQNSLNKQNDVNNSLYLYDYIYSILKKKPDTKDYKINNIHALYLLENLQEKPT